MDLFSKILNLNLLFAKFRMKYFYLVPHGGFNDILSRIHECIKYCQKFNRILLINTFDSTYGFNFSDYFTIYLPNIIYDNIEVQKILSENKHTMSFYPSNNYLEPSSNINFLIDYAEDIIMYRNCGGCTDNYVLFRYIHLNPILIDFCRSFYEKIPKPYMAIQIRNKDGEDYQMNYKKLIYEDYKDLLYSQKAIYIATDDNKCVEFFKTTGLNVYNFTTFPSTFYPNLHNAGLIDGIVQLKELVSDLCICGLADIFLSKSKGLFTDLCRGLNENKYILQKQFGLPMILPPHLLPKEKTPQEKSLEFVLKMRELRRR
jgi:hypothetical protein